MAAKRDASSSSSTDDATSTLPFTSPKRPRRDLVRSTSAPADPQFVAATALHVSELPTPVFTRILAYALPGFVPAAQCVPHCPNLPIRRFKAIASVSRAWMLAARRVVQHFVRSVLDYELLAAPSQDDVDELQRELTQRGEQLFDLRLTVDSTVRAKDLAVLDWRALLRACPKLQRLDLRGVPLEHRMLSRVLDAAAAQCHELQALVLPKRSSATAKQSAITAAYEQLADALESWSDCGCRLKQLTIPDRGADDAAAPTSALLTVLAESCAALAYLDGWKATYRVDSYVECSEQWYVSLPIWSHFCDAVSATLREFNWVVAPCHDAYVARFAAVRKPELQRLCLTVSESWSWDEFAARCDEEAQASDNDDEGECTGTANVPTTLVAPPTTATLCALVAALPHLEALDVIVHANMDEIGSLDAEACSDAFLHALAASCCLLRSFKLVDLGRGDEAQPIESITCVGIATLSRMACLQDVVITGIVDSSENEHEPLRLFAFVEHWRDVKRQRTVSIGVHDESAQAFYIEALDLLTQLRDAYGPRVVQTTAIDAVDADTVDYEEPTAPPLATRQPCKFAIKLCNGTTAPDFVHLKAFCKRYNRLARDLETQLPWLRVAALADGVLEHGRVSAFSAIGYVVVATQDANLYAFEALQTLAPPAAVAATPKRKQVKKRLLTPNRASVNASRSSADRTMPSPSKRKRLELPSSSESANSSDDDDGGASSYGSVADGDETRSDNDNDDVGDTPTKKTENKDDDENDEVEDFGDSSDDASAFDDSLDNVMVLDSSAADDSLDVIDIDSD